MPRCAPGLRTTLVACLAVAGCGASPGAGAGAQGISETGSAPAAATLASPKISPALAALARRVRAAANGTAAAALSGPTAHVNTDGEIEVYVHVSQVGPAAADALRRAGARIGGSAEALGVYQAWAAPPALARLAALAQVLRISLPAYGRTRNGQPPG